MTNLVDTAAARSQVFQLLALGFVHPVPELHAMMIDGRYQSMLSEAMHSAFDVEIAVDNLSEDFKDYEAHYIEVFQMGRKGQPVVHLNAGDYTALIHNGGRPEFLLEYSGWYRHFGVKVNAQEHSNELPDHLVCQLEFMAWLSHIEQTEKLDLQYGYQCAQKDFFERHLLPFIAEMNATINKEQACVRPVFIQLANVALEALKQSTSLFEEHIKPAQQDQQQAQTIPTVNLWG